MYKFTNGIVVFDEKTRDNYLKAGYKLEIKSEKIESQHIPAGIVKFDEKTRDNYLKAGYKLAKTGKKPAKTGKRGI